MEKTLSISNFVNVSRFHITVIAALGVFTFGWLFTGLYPWLLTAVVAFDWFIVNLTNRIVDIEEDSANRIPGAAFALRNRNFFIAVLSVILVVSLAFVHFLNPAITPLRVLGHLLGVFYNWPLLPGARRLKELYFWKNTASAAGFMITVFGYPLADLVWSGRYPGFPPGISWGTVLFSAIFFFLFEVSYEVIYDLRDVRGDALAGIRTYPVVHGERAAATIIDGLMLSSMAALAIGYGLGVIPWRIFIMIAVPPIQFVVYKRALKTGISAADCIHITWMGAGLMVIYHLWVILGLPGTEL